MEPRTSGNLSPGDLIADRYEVRRLLGKGGMGCVYLVEDRETHQPLALKTLLPHHLNNDRALQRFAREVKAVRQLNHPSIVRIYDARKVGSLLFYTMDYVKGKSLHNYIRERGRLGLGSTVRILSLLCHTLEHAHKYTIHRDLSPDNVMILADGSIRLLDFGLAKLLGTGAQFTMIGTSLGKMHYNAPEQRRNAADVDLRADIYSLGVMFFAMLTGQLPHGTEKITGLRPDLPAECDALYAKATAHNRDDRFADARHMRQALMDVYQASRAKADEEALSRQINAASRPFWAPVVGVLRRLFRRPA